MKKEAEKTEEVEQLSKEELELDLKRKTEVINETQKLLNYETGRYKDIHRGMMLAEVLKERDIALEIKREKEKKEAKLRKQQEEEHKKRTNAEIEKEKSEKLKRKQLEKEWAMKRDEQIILKKQEKEKQFQEEVEENQRKAEVIKNEIDKERHLQQVEKLERETLIKIKLDDLKNKQDHLKKMEVAEEDAFKKMYTVQDIHEKRKKDHILLHNEKLQRIAARQEKVFQLRAKSFEGKRDYTDEINSKYLEEFDKKHFYENLAKEEKKKELTKNHYQYHDEVAIERKKKEEQELKTVLEEREANAAKALAVKDEVKRRKDIEKSKLSKLNNFWSHQIKELEDKRKKEIDDEKMLLNVAFKKYNEEEDELERYVEDLILNEKQRDLNVYPIIQAKKSLSLGR